VGKTLTLDTPEWVCAGRVSGSAVGSVDVGNVDVHKPGSNCYFVWQVPEHNEHP
jgi:hypothetical protein